MSEQESKHTPVWKMATNEVGFPDSESVCCVTSYYQDAIDIYSPGVEQDDDPLPRARLIVSAPALLEACKLLLDPNADGNVAERTALAAIAAAEGEQA